MIATATMRGLELTPQTEQDRAFLMDSIGLTLDRTQVCTLEVETYAAAVDYPQQLSRVTLLRRRR